MRAFNVVLDKRVIDTVFYADSDPIEAYEVFRSLVNHDGYSSSIVVREQRAVRKARRAVVRDWKCQECGKLMTLKQAERATHTLTGCTGCGGADIDLA